MSGDGAVGFDLQDCMATGGFGGGLKVPFVEAGAGIEDGDGLPASGGEGVAPFGDRLVLQDPELVGVGEQPFVGKEVGGDGTGVLLEREQGDVCVDGVATEQPGAELPGLRLGIGFVELQILGLPGLGGDGKELDGFGVDCAGAVKGLDARHQA